jgi:tight adherence protein C
MLIVLIVMLTIGAIGLGAWSASTVIETRVAARRSLGMIEGYDNVNVREQEMMKSAADRVVQPLVESFGRLVYRLTPVGYLAKIRRDIVLAGSPPGYEVDRFMVWKVLGVASGIVWVPLILWVFGSHSLLAWIAIAFAWGVSIMGPDLELRHRIENRREAMSRGLSDTLDLLVISVEAGLGFEQALDRTANTVPGPLSEEMRRVLQEIRMGASRADALRALDERTQVEDLKSFIIAMLQADTFGVSIAKILNSQADEIRTRRRQAAQEKSQKAPIKMLFPLAVCIFPAIFVVVLVPGLIQVFDKL